jgi:hypothetical protein
MARAVFTEAFGAGRGELVDEDALAVFREDRRGLTAGALEERHAGGHGGRRGLGQ